MDENFNINNNDNESVAPENEKQTGIRFSVKETVDIVSTENVSSNKSNKTAIIILIAVVIIAIICGLILFFVNDEENNSETETTTEPFSINYEDLENAFNSESFTNKEGQSISAEEYKDYIQSIIDEASTVLNENTGSANPHSIVENTTNKNTSSEDKQPVLNYDKNICESYVKAFLDRSCYLEGALVDAGPVAAAFDGDNFEMLTSLDGTEISIIRMDGNIYFKRTALKQYAQITDAVMQMFGLSANMFSFDFGDKDYNEMKDHLTSIIPVIIDGEDGVCFRYDKNNGFFKFYFVNNKLVQLDVGEDKQIISSFIITHFSASVPGDMLSLKGYTETGFISLFADYMDE